MLLMSSIINCLGSLVRCRPSIRLMNSLKQNLNAGPMDSLDETVRSEEAPEREQDGPADILLDVFGKKDRPGNIINHSLVSIYHSFGG